MWGTIERFKKGKQYSQIKDVIFVMRSFRVFEFVSLIFDSYKRNHCLAGSCSWGPEAEGNSDRGEVCKQQVPVVGTNILKSGVCAIFLNIYTCWVAKKLFSNMVPDFLFRYLLFTPLVISGKEQNLLYTEF